MPIDPEHPLAVGARMIDDLGDAKGYVDTIGEMGLDADEVEYVARQRAYRVWLLLKGGPELVLEHTTTGKPLPQMSADDHQLIEVLTAASASSIVLGWTGRGVFERRKEQDADSGSPKD